MKKYSTIFMLTVAAILASCNGNKAEAPAKKTTAKPEVKAKELKIAFVLIDTLTNQYELYKEASDAFQKKQANAEATINAKGKNFANQVQEFQRKAQSNQLTQQQYENEQARLAKLQQDIQDLQQRLSVSLQEEYQKELQALTDTIQNFMKSYAKEKGFDFILCKSSGIDNVLYGNPKYDITDEVVKALNKRYAKEKKATPKKEEKK
jgi:outer membrane protein